MKYYSQPNNKTCGQTSVAMVLGITPEESIKLYGHDHTTRFPEHIKVLKSQGYDVTTFQKVDNRKRYELPETCLIRLCRSGKRTGHMVVHHKGKFYDPSRFSKGIYDNKEDLLKSYPKGWRIEYYLEVKGNNKSVVENPQEEVLAQVAGDKRYKVRVSHDIFNTGEKHYLTRIVTKEGLEKLEYNETFKVEFVEEYQGE